MAAKFVDYLDIAPTKKFGPLLKNYVLDPKDMMRMRIYYDDKWTEPPRGIITYHFGTAGGDLPPITDPRVSTALGRGFILAVCVAQVKSGALYTYNNYYPLHSTPYHAMEIESYLETIFTRAVNHSILKSFINSKTSVVLSGTSKGGGITLAWSLSSDNVFKTYRDNVVCIVSNSPMGGNSNSANGQWAMIGRLQRSQINSLIGVKHPTLFLNPVGDVTHQVKSTAERVRLSIHENPLVEMRTVGKNATYSHGWTYSKPAEFINMALDFAEDYVPL